MGGGSSNDDKVNEINKNQTQQILENDKKNDNKKDKKNKQSPLNSKNVSKNNSPRGYNSSTNKKQTGESPRLKISPQQNSKQPLKKSNLTKQVKISRNTYSKNTNLRKQKFGTTYFLDQGKYQIKIHILQLKLKNQPKKQSFIQELNSQHQGQFSWQWDKNKKDWVFQLIQQGSYVTKFLFNSKAQLIKGQQSKWLALNPVPQNYEAKTFGAYSYQSSYIQNQNDKQQQGAMDRTQASLNQNKQNICAAWGQQYVDSFVNFQSRKPKTNNKETEQILTNYAEVDRYFYMPTGEWSSTTFFQQKDLTFKAWLIFKQPPSNDIEQNSEFQILIDKQKRIIQLKRLIYIHKMHKYLQTK